jgi:hypothetical protein
MPGMETPDAVNQSRRQGIGEALLLLAATDPVKAYFLLKQIGLCIADLQEAGFTDADLRPLKRGWREVQKRIASDSIEEPNIVSAQVVRH